MYLFEIKNCSSIKKEQSKLYYRIKKAIGAVRRMVNTTLSNQMTTSFPIVRGISVDKIHGTTAEKKIIDDTETTAITNLVTMAALVTNRAGKNISAIETALAFAASIGSGN